MFDTDTQMVLDVWEVAKENIPLKHREETAIKLLKVLEDYISVDGNELLGTDKHFDNAVKIMFDMENDVE